MTTERLIVKCILFTFKQSFFNPSSLRSNLILTIVLTILMLFGIGCIWAAAFVNEFNTESSIGAISYGVAGIVGLSNYIILLRNRNNVINLLDNIDRDLFRYDRSIDLDYDGLLKESNMKRLTICLTIIFYTDLLIAVIISILARLIWNDLNALICPATFPWNTSPLTGYLLSCFVLTCVGCYTCAASLGNVVYITLIYLEYERQYRRLRTALSRLSNNRDDSETTIDRTSLISTVNDDRSRNRIYDDRFVRRLKECVDHHRALTRNFKYFKPYFEMNFSIEFCQCILTLCLSLHSLIEALENGSAPSTIAVLCFLLQSLYLKCYVAEKFSELNGTITDTIYDLPWYEQSVSNRKLLHIFQLQTQRPYIMKAWGVFPASLFIFAKVIRTTYSFLNIIRAS